MGRVPVSPAILEWAISRSGQSEDSLRSVFPKLPDWLSGDVNPTFNQLEKFARKTRTTLGFLFLSSPPDLELPIPHFRTLDGDTVSTPSPDLLATVYAMQRRQDWFRDYLIELDSEPLDFVGSIDSKASAEDTAKAMKKILGLEGDWSEKESSWQNALSTLRDSMNQVGIIVVTNGVVGNNTNRVLDVSEFRGFVLVDNYAPLVFINGSDGKAAQMFTLAHELAHVFLGSSAAFDLRQMQPADDPTERVCNELAAEFLVPARLLQESWRIVADNPNLFNNLARQFKVSAIVVARRALDLGLVSREEFFEFYEEHKLNWVNAKKQAASGGDFYINQNFRLGDHFGAAVVRAVMEGQLLYSQAYELTNLYGRTFQKYAEHLDQRVGGL